ncbi:MAG: hypothetical protein ACMXYC_03710 [Candidatus Woesearchaeota archaeon]
MKTLQERKDEGHLKARVVLQVIGKPKDHVEKSLKQFIKEIESNELYLVEHKTVHKGAKHEGNLFSAFSELDMWFENIPAVLNFCLDYTPSSVELDEPEYFKFHVNEVNDVVNDFIAKLHTVNQQLQDANQLNKILVHNNQIITQNAIVVLLHLGPQTKQTISQAIGIKEEHLDAYLNILLEQQKIKQEGEKYLLP